MITGFTSNKEIVSFIKTQKGCRYFQNKVEKNKKFLNKTLYPCIKDYIFELIQDQYGNYLIQEIFCFLNEANFLDMIEFISLKFKIIIYSCYGSRVVQKLIDKIGSESNLSKKILQVISKQTKSIVVEMSTNEHANHVIRRFLEVVNPKYTDYIYEEIKESFLKVAKNKFGCCVVAKCLISGSESQKNLMTYLVLENTYNIIDDPFGNYIYQCLLLNGDNYVTSCIYSIIYKKFFSLCKGKYSSNVMEKFFKIDNQKLINVIASRLIQNKTKVVELVDNKYGSYIIQKLLSSTVDKYLRNKIVTIILKYK